MRSFCETEILFVQVCVFIILFMYDEIKEIYFFVLNEPWVRHYQVVIIINFISDFYYNVIILTSSNSYHIAFMVLYVCHCHFNWMIVYPL